MLLTSLIALVAFCGVAGARPGNTSKAEAELRQIEETRRHAIATGDTKTLDRIYADDFVAIAGNGQVITKTDLFAVLARNDPSVVFTTDEINVRIFGETAVFTGRLTGRAQDGTVVSVGRFTHVFVKRAGRWQCVAGQSTPLPKS